MNKLITIIILSFFARVNFAQTDTIYEFTVQQAIDYGIEHNLNIQNKEYEMRKAKWKVWETTAIGLPQVSGSAEYQNFPDIPTQLMPDFITPAIVGVNTSLFGLQPLGPLPETGGKMPVQFGSEHNMDWGISISQLIFSGEYIVGLQASRTYKLLSEQNYEKAKIELKGSIEQAYYLALISKQSLEIMRQNYENIKELEENTQKLVSQGVANQTQADQMKILALNLKNQISSLERQELLSMQMLKFQTGMFPNDSLVLLSSLNDFISTLTLSSAVQDFNINSNIDYQMINTQVALAKLQYRQAETKTLPTVMGFYSYQEKAMSDDFNFFEDEAEWYPTSVWGIKIQVPLFASGQKYSVIQQQKIALYEAKNQQSLVENQLNLQFEQARNDYLTAFDNLLNQEQNKNLSEKIYKDTQIQFKEGTASSMDLTQAQNQYLQAEAAYYQALLQLINAKISLDKLLNQ